MKRIYPEEDNKEYKGMELKVVNFINDNDILSKRINNNPSKFKEGTQMKKLNKKIKKFETLQLFITMMLPVFMVIDWFAVDPQHITLLFELMAAAILVLLIQIKITALRGEIKLKRVEG